MKWLILLALISCSNKYDNRWCAQPVGKRELCYPTEEKCKDAQIEKQTGVFCKASEKL